MTRRLNATALSFAAALLLAGCHGPTGTIGELGFPVFNPVVGPETVFERPDPKQIKGMDAFNADVDAEADHRFAVSFWPISSDRRVALQVKAKAMGAMRIKQLAAAVYPGTRAEAERFSLRGALPHPGAKAIHVETATEHDANGNAILMMAFERSALPEGVERLLIPTLAQFDDGWIHVRYYQTAIPAPIRTLSPEEVEVMRERERAAREAEQGGGSPRRRAGRGQPPAGEQGAGAGSPPASESEAAH